MNRFSVTVIVGATNEARSLAQTVKRLMADCSAEDLERILIVRSVNASQDCIDVIRDMASAYPGVVEEMVQRRPHIGGAIQDGFDAAESSHILLLPGDLAIDLSSVPRLIEKEKQYPDEIVKTSRWLARDSFREYPVVRKHLNALAQLFLRVLFFTELTDLTNPVQIMPTALYRCINWQELDFPFLTELILCPLRLGVSFHEVPVKCYGRKEGKSNNSAGKTMAYLKTALRIRFSPKYKLIRSEDWFERTH